jgi:hypothetical protein
MADEPNDAWRRPYDPYAGEGARERYLRWEIDLVRQTEREGDLGFRIDPLGAANEFPPGPAMT